MKKGLISLLFLLSCGVWDAAAQDLIVKKDGTNVEAKVLEIGEKDIKYKKASHLDGRNWQGPSCSTFFTISWLMTRSLLSSIFPAAIELAFKEPLRPSMVIH